mmetsp:Transcript_30070/g.82579  ORF Transcript_30070/g.82579 Transcript_30070/m.82579 type:complete len:443 (-) Transcript_30070:237-1565(-)
MDSIITVERKVTSAVGLDEKVDPCVSSFVNIHSRQGLANVLVFGLHDAFKSSNLGANDHHWSIAHILNHTSNRQKGIFLFLGHKGQCFHHFPNSLSGSSHSVDCHHEFGRGNNHGSNRCSAGLHVHFFGEFLVENGKRKGESRSKCHGLGRIFRFSNLVLYFVRWRKVFGRFCQQGGCLGPKLITEHLVLLWGENGVQFCLIHRGSTRRELAQVCFHVDVEEFLILWHVDAFLPFDNLFIHSGRSTVWVGLAVVNKIFLELLEHGIWIGFGQTFVSCHNTLDNITKGTFAQGKFFGDRQAWFRKRFFHGQTQVIISRMMTCNYTHHRISRGAGQLPRGGPRRKRAAIDQDGSLLSARLFVQNSHRGRTLSRRTQECQKFQGNAGRGRFRKGAVPSVHHRTLRANGHRILGGNFFAFNHVRRCHWCFIFIFLSTKRSCKGNVG